MQLCRILSLAGVLMAFSLPSFAESIECRQAMSQLDAKIELYEQVGKAFLQSNDTLEEVYSTFAKRLAEAKNTAEVASISRHFENSAKGLREAKQQNSEMLKALAEETAALKARVAQCVAGTAK